MLQRGTQIKFSFPEDVGGKTLEWATFIKQKTYQKIDHKKNRHVKQSYFVLENEGKEIIFLGTISVL